MKSLLKVLWFVALAGLMAGCSTFHQGAVSSAPGVGQYTSDSVITSKVKAKYAKDSHLRSYGIGVSTNRGVVTLVGKLPNEQLKERAITIAMHTKGVSAVDAKNLSTPEMLTLKKAKVHHHKRAMKKAKASAATGAAASSTAAPAATTSTTTPMPAPVTPVQQQ